MKSHFDCIRISGILLVLVAVAFPLNISAQKLQATSLTTKIEVLYFHAPNRCPSCVATEDQTRSVVSKYFAPEVADKRISFISLDLKEKSNQALVEKYEIVFPTLLLIKKRDKLENVNDFSTTAFQYAYADPEKYAVLLQAEIKKLLEIK